MHKIEQLMKLAELIDFNEKTAIPECEPHHSNSTPFEVGKSYLIRTVTLYSVGRVKSVYPGFLVLSDASWIADTGRYHDALKSASLHEVEPCVSDQIVSLGAIVDATEWTHKLPEVQK